jgi:hypothetical protein
VPTVNHCRARCRGRGPGPNVVLSLGNHTFLANFSVAREPIMDLSGCYYSNVGQHITHADITVDKRGAAGRQGRATRPTSSLPSRRSTEENKTSGAWAAPFQPCRHQRTDFGRNRAFDNRSSNAHDHGGHTARAPSAAHPRSNFPTDNPSAYTKLSILLPTTKKPGGLKKPPGR